MMCSEPGCSREAVVKGMCRTCYMRQYMRKRYAQRKGYTKTCENGICKHPERCPEAKPEHCYFKGFTRFYWCLLKKRRVWENCIVQ